MTAEMITALSALIVGIASIISAVMLNRKTMALLEYRMSRVEDSLQEHNHYASRFEEIEKAIVAIQKDVEYIKKEVESA